jgi:hypothetical protein
MTPVKGGPMKAKSVAGPWLRIRESSQEENIIRMHIMHENGEELYLLSTIRLGPCQKDKQLFDDWVKACSDGFKRAMIGITGQPQIELQVRRPKEE